MLTSKRHVTMKAEQREKRKGESCLSFIKETDDVFPA